MKTYSYKDSPLEMHGLPFFSENHIIERVPSEVREKVPSLAFLGRRPAGARLCFRTNSKNLRVKMTLGTLSPDIGMSLFACQSSDVMIGERSRARFAGLVTPPDYDTKVAEKTFGKSGEMEDITIFLPRNEIVEDLEISVDDDASVELYKNSIGCSVMNPSAAISERRPSASISRSMNSERTIKSAAAYPSGAVERR